MLLEELLKVSHYFSYFTLSKRFLTFRNVSYALSVIQTVLMYRPVKNSIASNPGQC